MIREVRFLFVITTRMKIDYVFLLKSTKNGFFCFKKKRQRNCPQTTGTGDNLLSYRWVPGWSCDLISIKWIFVVIQQADKQIKQRELW